MSYEYYVPYAIWFKKSTKQRGYEFKVNEVFQGNQSEMKIKKNGRKSCMGSSCQSRLFHQVVTKERSLNSFVT